jgi:hypothetical protein
MLKYVGVFFGFLFAFWSSLASAAVDVTAVTAAITDASGAIATVGSAVLVLTVGIFVYKWIRRAL